MATDRLTEPKAVAERATDPAARPRGPDVNSLRILAGVLAVATVVAVGLAIYAFNQSADSKRDTRIAFARELTAASAANLGGDPERSVLLALRAIETYGAHPASVPPAAVEALHRAIQASRVRLTLRDTATKYVAFSPDGKLLATAGTGAIVWNTHTGRKIRSFPSRNKEVDAVALSSDGSRLFVNVSGVGTSVWNVRTGKRLYALRGRERIMALAVSAAGDRLTATSAQGTLTIWDLRTREIVRRTRSPGSLCARGSGSACESPIAVAYSPGRDRIVAGGVDGKGRLWDARSGRLLATFEGHTGRIVSATFSPDGRRVATGSSDGTARVWDASTGRELLILAGHGQTVSGVAFGPRGRELATGSLDGTARIWDVSAEGARDALTLAAHRGIGGAETVAYGPDGTLLATGGFGPAQARLWEAKTGRELRKLPAPANTFDATFSPDGTRVVLVGGGDAAVVVEVRTRRAPMRLRSRGSTAGAWSSDAALIAVGGDDGRVGIWNARTAERVRTLVHPRGARGLQAVDGVAFSPDGRQLVTAAGRTLAFWNVATWRQVNERSVRAETMLNSVAFAPQGRRLLTASVDGTAVVRALPSGRKLLTLRGHVGPVWDAVWSHDGRLIATAGDDTTVRLWNGRTGSLRLTLTGATSAVRGVAFSPNGDRLAAASADGYARVYILPLDELMSTARSRLTRGWSLWECQEFLSSSRCPTTP